MLVFLIVSVEDIVVVVLRTLVVDVLVRASVEDKIS
jgi:hypothetical protein